MRKKLLAGMLALALCSTNMPLQTIFAEEFTSGNQDVVSEEETPEIFTNEELKRQERQMRNCLYSVQTRFLNLMMPPMRQWLLRKMNKLEKLI